MAIVKIAQYDDDEGLTIEGAIAAANGRKLRLLSNAEIDARLNKTGEWKQEQEMYPCWTGTFIAYEEPGKPFGSTVQFRSLTLSVPKKFQGKVDCAIVCNHPDFTLKDGTFTLGKTARCIPFLRKDGWHLPDRESGIPNGQQSNSQNDRYLYRRDDEQYVGLVARGDWWGGDGYRRNVVCVVPVVRLGVFGDDKRAKPAGKHKHEWACTICGEKRK